MRVHGFNPNGRRLLRSALFGRPRGSRTHLNQLPFLLHIRQRGYRTFVWCYLVDSNQRRSALQADALPTELRQLGTDREIRTHTERVLNPMPLPKLGYVGFVHFRAIS